MKECLWNKFKRIIISIIFFLVLWEIAAIIINNEIYLPRLKVILQETINLIVEKDFLINVVSTVNRTIISFIIALGLSILFGVLSIVSPVFESIIKPFNSIGKTIPTMILVLLALIWVNKNQAPYIVGVGIAFPIMYEGIINSIRDMDKSLIEMMKVYEVSKKSKIKSIYIPIIKNYIMTIIVSTFSLVFKVVVAGEVHGQPKYGIGAAVQIEKVNFNTPGIFSWILIIAFISVIFEIINNYLKRRMNLWKK
ncbi:MAG: ABC transporter permease [Clostridium sp.]